MDRRGRRRPAGHVAVPEIDDTRYLVTEHQGAVEHGISDAALGEPMPVRAAQSDRRDADQLVTRAGLRIRLIVQAQIARRVEADAPHQIE